MNFFIAILKIYCKISVNKLRSGCFFLTSLSDYKIITRNTVPSTPSVSFNARSLLPLLFNVHPTAGNNTLRRLIIIIVTSRINYRLIGWIRESVKHCYNHFSVLRFCCCFVFVINIIMNWLLQIWFNWVIIIVEIQGWFLKILKLILKFISSRYFIRIIHSYWFTVYYTFILVKIE